MYIKKVKIRNFKCFKEDFTLGLRNGINVLVGDNDSGKSTILEAINLALSGLFHGRFLRNELSEHLFNKDAVEAYIRAPGKGLPSILIELYLDGEGVEKYKGDGNSEKDSGAAGIKFEVRFDEQYQTEYEELVNGGVSGLPIEYYEIVIESFARERLTTRGISLSTAFIDSSGARYQNGSDAYVSRIVKDFLDEKELVALAKVHREMADAFKDSKDVEEVNKKIREANSLLSERELSLAVDMASRSAWESNLITCIDRIPFQYIGKGEQSLAKIAIALAHKKAQSANVLLIEEPENHLSHSRLNLLIELLLKDRDGKQIIVTTHSSFVANKSDLKHLIMLHEGKTVRFDDLNPDTRGFFQKLAGYDTLRLLLCKKAILVEGDSDELVVQKAYCDKHGKLPIADAIDVISVGISFLRFLEIADKLGKPVAVVTDNDGNVEALQKKYAKYLGEKAKGHIKICFDSSVDARKELYGEKFNFNTLEPKILEANGRKTLGEIFGGSFTSDDELLKHMKANKTECALKIFNTDKAVVFPAYIAEAIED